MSSCPVMEKYFWFLCNGDCGPRKSVTFYQYSWFYTAKTVKLKTISEKIEDKINDEESSDSLELMTLMTT
jgi:hypothetical protein